MHPFPEDNSVIIMDNAKIHHDSELIILIEGLGCHVIFLPPYSLDFNPIETSFSTIKSWIRHNRDFMNTCDNPIYALLVACGQISPELAKSFFDESMY